MITVRKLIRNEFSEKICKNLLACLWFFTVDVAMAMAVQMVSCKTKFADAILVSKYQGRKMTKHQMATPKYLKFHFNGAALMAHTLMLRCITSRPQTEDYQDLARAVWVFNGTMTNSNNWERNLVD